MLTVVIPCYNEEARLPATVDAIKRYLGARGDRYELILADDGSVDGTQKVIAAAMAGASNVRNVHLVQNRGKGRALAEGVALSKGDRILLTDADLSTPIEELPKLEAKLDAGAGVAIASRSIKGSEVVVSQPVYRVLMGKTFNLMVQALLLPGLWDTQCGFKLFKGDLARSVFADMRTDGFGYDPEALFLATKRGARIAEVPVVWRHSAPTEVLVVLPTYNEHENVERVVSAVRKLGHDVMIVDDSSPDGTGEIADKLAAADPGVRVLHRPSKLGLGSAYKDAFRLGLADGSQLFVEMDADGSHRPQDLQPIVDAARKSGGLALGSRYIPGGSIEGWPKRRWLLSWGANI